MVLGLVRFISAQMFVFIGVSRRNNLYKSMDNYRRYEMKIRRIATHIIRRDMCVMGREINILVGGNLW